MRATEFIIEAGVLGDIKKDYQSGYDAVAKVLNPKRWGDTDKSDDSSSAAPVNKLDLRDALNLVAAGKTMYLKDQQILKQAHAQIKSGKFKVNQDSEQLLAALDSAKNLQKLSPQQQQILLAFAQDL
jgi:DNA-binding NarL/FixJ family response regulator